MLEDSATGLDLTYSTRANLCGLALACLAVRLMLSAVRAELLQLKPIGVVAAILLGDVVAVFAHLAGQSDLRPNVGTGRHVNVSF
jgi:hypothetical protein